MPASALLEAESDVSSLLKEGKTALARGAYPEALALLLDAFTHAPDEKDVQAALIDALGCTSGYDLPQSITNKLADAAVIYNHDVQALAMVVTNQVERHPDIDRLIQYFAEQDAGTIEELPEELDFEGIVYDQLFMLVCSRATIASEKVEKLITQLRRHYLAEWLADATSKPLLIGRYPELLGILACQCFNSEFIYDVTPYEEERVERLQEVVFEDIRAAHPIDLAVLGAYKPLWATLQAGNAEDLQYLIDESDRWAGWIQLVWKLQFMLPLNETLIKQQIPPLTPITDNFSSAIAHQYEEFPYPRWQTTRVPERSMSLKDYVSHRFPQLDNRDIPSEPCNILFAGCGTGEQIVSMGTAFHAKNTLALDLSLNSLAYAKRKSDELGIENIHYGQADILSAAKWDASFDLIVCTGVLHHMSDPTAGLSALQQLSKPHSVYFLALYSERGRACITAAQQLATQHGLKDGIEDMRSFRQLVRALPEDHPAKAVMYSRDFYSASGLHDFVFNKHELRYSPAGLKELLEAHNLQFLGFDLAQGEIAAQYLELFPGDPGMTDLDNWDQFEDQHPDTFGDMMQFWCTAKN